MRWDEASACVHSRGDASLDASIRESNFKLRTLERFYNSHAIANVVRGGFFLRKKPLGSNGFEVQQLWNRCRYLDREFCEMIDAVVRQSVGGAGDNHAAAVSIAPL